MRPVLSFFGPLLVVFWISGASKAALFNVTAEDCTSLIAYNPPGAWTDSVVNDSSQPQNYSGSSWHSTTFLNATASFTFNGTGIWFFGAKQPGYGTYGIVVDGNHIATDNADAVEDEFQVLLGGAGNLSAGEHTASLVGLSGGRIDLDVIMFETWADSSSSSDGSISSEDINGVSSELQANPASGWQVDSVSGTQSTDLGGAQMLYSFEGDALAIYGPMSSTSGAYSILIDGKETFYSAIVGSQQNIVHQNSLMYFANNLGPGPHNLTLTANPDQPGASGTGKTVGISAISVYRSLAAEPGPPSVTAAARTAIVEPTGQPTGTLLTFPSSKASPTSAQGGLSETKKRIIIAAIAGGAGLFVGIGAVILYFSLRRHRRKRREMAKALEPPPSPKSFVQRPSSNATGAWGRPAIPASVLQSALTDPFADYPAVPPLPTISIGGAREDPFADPAGTQKLVVRPESAFKNPRASPTPTPTFATAAQAQVSSGFRRSLSPEDRYGLSPSPTPSASSKSSYGSENPYVVPWTPAEQYKSSVRDAEEGRKG